jgi:hypothetical protein
MQDDETPRIPRRTVLKAFGAVGLAATVAPDLLRWDRTTAGAAELARLLRASSPDGRAALTPNLQVFMQRRDDLLDLRFDLYNLSLDTSGSSPVLVPTASPAWVVVVFPMQSVGEYVTAVGSTPPAMYTQTPEQSLASGPSQLAFEVPAGVTAIPFTVEGLLDWTSFSPLLPAVAQQDGAAPATDPTGPPTPASPPLTYVEMAWQLLVAPGPLSFWDSAPAPVTYAGWTELWQARLSGSVVPPALPELYAVWTPGYSPNSLVPTGDPFLMSLSDGTQASPTNQNRLDLVALSSQFGGAGNQVNGTGAVADLFMLTGLGASTDVRGTYDSGVSDIVSWHHKMSVGRDTFVQVVHAGYLFPFGHRAVLIQTTDREFHVSPQGDVVAYLIERTTVQVNQPTVTYPYPDEGAVGQAWAGRQNPFTQIEVKTLNTPPLDTAFSSPNPIAGVPTADAQWIMVDSRPYPFAMVGTDAEGRRVAINTAAIWVSTTVTENGSTGMAQINDIETSYAAAGNVAWRQPPLDGQLLAFAPTTPGGPGATALHTDSVVFDALPYKATSADNGSFSPTSPPWYPVLSSASVRLPAVSQLSGAAGDDASATGPVVSYDPTYLANGFVAGVPEVYLDIVTNTQPLDFSQSAPQSAQSGTSLSGGMVSPNFTVDGLARDLGAVADAKHMAAATFNPSAFFAGLDATILGSVSLAGIIAPQSGAAAGPNAPKITSVPVYPAGAGHPPTKPPTATRTTIEWTPAVQASGNFVPNSQTKLQINVVIYTPLGGGAPSYTIHGQLRDFTLSLFGTGAGQCVVVDFTTVHFSSRTGAKSNVEVSIDTVTFVGALSWVQALSQLFSSLGGPSIDLEPSGIKASYSVAIPSIGIGVFSIENMSLGGSLNIPFTGQPVRLEVDFCSRDNPFLLTIYIFTGGGWFAIRLGADGIELVEVGLEFGASVSIDLGVASGGVSIMAGIYFALGSSSVDLTGFFKASGNLEVLGILSISIVFYLGLTYKKPPGDVYGTASVSVTVSLLCFSASVSLTVTKELSSADPVIPFAAAISATAWNEYCASFA